MPLRIVAVSPDEPRDDRLLDAVDVLRRGGIVALPTETVYGLAADASRPEALQRLNRLKGKAADAPLLLLLADTGQAGAVAGPLPDGFDALAARFWPGPLTVVVPALSSLPREISGGRGTVAIRVPGMILPRRLASRLGGPVTGISANLHGRPPCRTAHDVVATFGDGLEMVLDGGTAPGGTASTIVDLTGPRPRLLRRGTLPLAALAPFLPGLYSSPSAQPD